MCDADAGSPRRGGARRASGAGPAITESGYGIAGTRPPTPLRRSARSRGAAARRRGSDRPPGSGSSAPGRCVGPEVLQPPPARGTRTCADLLTFARAGVRHAACSCAPRVPPEAGQRTLHEDVPVPKLGTQGPPPVVRPSRGEAGSSTPPTAARLERGVRRTVLAVRRVSAGRSEGCARNRPLRSPRASPRDSPFRPGAPPAATPRRARQRERGRSVAPLLRRSIRARSGTPGRRPAAGRDHVTRRCGPGAARPSRRPPR